MSYLGFFSDGLSFDSDSMINVELIDRDTINYLVDQLENIDKDKAIRKGLGLGGAYILRGGRSRLRSRMSKPSGKTGNLLKSFSVKVKRNKLGALVGFRYPLGRHAWLLDLGTKDRNWRKKPFKNVGKIPGKKGGFKIGFWTETKVQDFPKAMDCVREGVERFVQRINEGRK